MSVSFIILTYDSGRTIKKCLESVSRQKGAKEIIVVDGGSRDETVEIARKFMGVKLLAGKNEGIASARNRGLESSKGEHVAFVDSDVVLPEDWTEKALKLLDRKGVAGVGGPGISPEKSLISESLNLLLYGKSPDEERFVESVATMDAMYRRSAIGNERFDETLETGEDPEFNMRLVKKGHKLVFSDKLKVWHYHPITMGSLMRKWYNYGKNYPAMCSRHSEFKDKAYYARMSYFPVLIAFLALSPLDTRFLLAAAAQLISVYLVYLAKGMRLAGPKAPLFSAVHTMKQLAQLAGTMVGIGKLF